MRRRHWLALFAVGTTSLASGYWFGLPLLTRIGAGEDPSSSIRWSPSERARLTPILAAESSSRPWEMADLLRRLNATTSPAGGTPLLEARAAIAARSHAEAEIRLLRTRREGTADAGEIAFLRASNFCAQRRYDDMRASLDDAIAADPMRAEFHFARGEVDRRQGRPNDAMEGYARAIERAKPGRVPTRETIAFRRRLLLIQSGHESEIGIAEVEAALALPSPSGDWLLTAAAMAIHRQDLADAARWMQRARTVMPLPLYLDRVDDFAFRKHISQSELKALFPTRQERARFHEISRPIFVDP